MRGGGKGALGYRGKRARSTKKSRLDVGEKKGEGLGATVMGGRA